MVYLVFTHNPPSPSTFELLLVLTLPQVEPLVLAAVVVTVVFNHLIVIVSGLVIQC